MWRSLWEKRRSLRGWGEAVEIEDGESWGIGDVAVFEGETGCL